MMGTKATLKELVKEAEKEAERQIGEEKRERKNRGVKQPEGCSKLHKTERNEPTTRFRKYCEVSGLRENNVC